jgi:hypothetical protein
VAFLAVLLSVGAAHAATQTFTVVNNGLTAYTINGTDNPTLTVVRGNTVVFNITATGHPFWLKTTPSTGTVNPYTDGVTGNGTQTGTLTWVVPQTGPATVFYNCSVHAAMTGPINIVNAAPGLQPIGVAAIALLLLGGGAFVLRRRFA